ncbi:TPA: ATP-dependent Clp protease ATP-binding subunit [Staphylococcus aureus]|nr:ATP-dependent Clp protease ATP-binding subunit [Staphylococcus aureus]HDJ2428466.1 ATP-dependent Clp protease ATP-binding subunit [Staphylococcus aureus]
MTNSNRHIENPNRKADLFFEEMNKELGYSLTQLYEPKHDVIGRDKELHQLDILMSRPLTPIALLIGLAGAGKTAIVETWLKMQKQKNKNVVLLSLALGAMSSDGNTLLQKRMESLMPKLKEYQDILKENDPNTEVVLFIDEVHMVVSIFGKGSKLGGDLLKTSLARSYVKVIAATTRIEYDSYIANDAPLARRFKNLAINEVNKDVTKQILQDSWLSTYFYNESDVRIDDALLDKIIEANRLYRPQFAEPAKSIDILESAIAIHRVENVDIDESIINRIFDEQYNITLNFQANFDHVYQTILNRVMGQPMALYTVGQAIKKLAFQLDNFSNRPKATMLFIGSSGVGKTEMTKALAEGLYDNPNKYKTFNMADYALANTSPIFRSELGKTVSHDSTVIVLLDEMEKAHKNVMQDLLAILDEGIVRHNEIGADGYMITHEVSLKNTIVIATSNVAADLFKDVNQYSRLRTTITQENMNEYSAALKQEYRDLEIDIHDALRDAFSPEFVGRFSNIVPFYALHETTLIEICHRSIMKLIKQLNSRPEGYNVKVREPMKWTHGGYNIVASELTMYVCFELANIDDSNFGGARAIKRYIDNEIFPSILDAILDNPDKRRFFVHTNGKCSFENPDYQVGLGDIIVEPAS